MFFIIKDTALFRPVLQYSIFIIREIKLTVGLYKTIFCSGFQLQFIIFPLIIELCGIQLNIRFILCKEIIFFWRLACKVQTGDYILVFIGVVSGKIIDPRKTAFLIQLPVYLKTYRVINGT
ncbi:hypothetical protein D9M72_615960 [compost metagenome]